MYLKTRQRGFTLVEMIIALFMFSVVIGGISGLFISAIKSQKNTLAHQRLLNQTSYALEYMSRALRMAKKQDNATMPPCIADGANYESDGTYVKFVNHLENDDCQKFFVENNQLKQVKNNGADTLELTDSTISVDSGNFTVLDQSSSQPKVTVSFVIRDNTLPAGQRPSISIQTTVSQRNLNIIEP